MKKAVVSLFALTVLLSSCYAPQKDCDAYKTGEFSFEYQVGDTTKMGRFVRGEAYSVDYYEGKVDSATVRWVNNCEFVLQDMNSRAAIHYKIISSTDSSYTFEYKSAVKNPNKKLRIMQGTAFRID
ncbi:hypothetical protein [Maribacter sp. 2307ULW6-5]|uniref:hypothetical protein n=1 Tax=Maribacter sp. 2307ULW6-5 TaxID=3386275 RepID=UPI0039BD5896